MDEGSKLIPERSFLGLSMSTLATLKVEEIYNNRTAVKLILGRIDEFLEEKSSLQQEQTILRDENKQLRKYQTAYKIAKSDSKAAVVFLAVGNILIGIGLGSFLTAKNLSDGLLFLILILGALLFGAGVFFTFKNRRL